MTDTSRKKWRTPRLHVFVRTRPQEAVLQPCKHLFADDGPSGTYNYCRLRTGSHLYCSGGCDSVVNS